MKGAEMFTGLPRGLWKRRFGILAMTAKESGNLAEREINDGCRVERQNLRNEETSDDANPEWATQLGANARAYRQGNAPK